MVLDIYPLFVFVLKKVLNICKNFNLVFSVIKIFGKICFYKYVVKGGQQSVQTPPWGCRKMAPNARIHVKFCMEGTFVNLF